jgi:hypothetical protein
MELKDVAIIFSVNDSKRARFRITFRNALMWLKEKEKSNQIVSIYIYIYIYY